MDLVAVVSMATSSRCLLGADKEPPNSTVEPLRSRHILLHGIPASTLLWHFEQRGLLGH